MVSATATPPQLQRRLGTYDCGRQGPTLLILAGIHGNEPAGVLAAERVLAALQQQRLELHGRVIGCAGNLPALQQGCRYVDRDLNRRWSADAIRRLLATGPSSVEDGQQQELLAIFDDAVRTARGPVLFVDLHSSSADGPPFLCLSDTLDNRRLGMATGIPILRGIEGLLDGASIDYFSSRGIAAMAVEGGGNDAVDTPRNHEAALWLLLQATGMLRQDDAALAAHRQQVERTAHGLPAMVEIVHRHPITAADGFRMAPGFVNFQPLQRGELLATDVRGELRAPGQRRVLLPLYQALGDDGYFLGRDVSPLWLGLSALLCRLAPFVHWLPGVRLDPEDRHRVTAAGWFLRCGGRTLLRLCGYGRQRPDGRRFAFTRGFSLQHNNRLRPRW